MTTERTLLILAGIVGFTAVALGAFGAHGLERWLADAADREARLGWWKTGSLYHLVHAVALAFVASLADRLGGAAPAVAGWSFLAGVLLFSGSLYLMTVTGVRALGMVTPIGGLAFLCGWAAVVWAAVRWQLR